MMQISGIILGMLLMGYIADQIGRKWGSCTTAGFMFIGGILLTASNGPTIKGWAIMFAVAQVTVGLCGCWPAESGVHSWERLRLLLIPGQQITV